MRRAEDSAVDSHPSAQVLMTDDECVEGHLTPVLQQSSLLFSNSIQTLPIPDDCGQHAKSSTCCLCDHWTPTPQSNPKADGSITFSVSHS